jgi:peptidoglycan hydrolase CwlO-like protein
LDTTLLTVSVICIVLTIVLVLIVVSHIQVRNELRRTQGLLESERLKKEVFKKESYVAFQLKEELEKKLDEASHLMKVMETDILLLQKDNEATESLLQTTQPEVHQLKIKLIEAQNTIARLKAQLQQKV